MPAHINLHRREETPSANTGHCQGAAWLSFKVGDDEVSIFIEYDQLDKAEAAAKAFNAIFEPQAQPASEAA